MADERSTVQRWTEAIAQNLVASALWVTAGLTAGALAIWLATDGADRVTVRVWWIALLLAVLVLTWIWVAVLTVKVRALTKPPAQPAAHPDAALLQRIDSLRDQLRTRDGTDPVEWQLGELYNSILAEVKRRPHDVSLAAVQRATQSPTAVHLTAQSAAVLSAGLAQLRSVVAADARPEAGSA